MGVSAEDIQSCINEIMRKRGFDNYHIDNSGSSSKGDGYLGEVNFVKVIVNLPNGGEKTYELVMKTAKTDDQLRENSPIADTYLREIFMYTEVFPLIAKFQNENAIDNIYKEYPECYSTNSTHKKETVVLGDLKASGYRVHDRRVPQNLDHVLFVFRTYAKLHGASLALKTKKPAVFEKLTANMTDLMGGFMIKSNMVPYFERYFQQGVDILIKNGRVDAAEKIKKEASDVAGILSKMTMCDDTEAEAEAVILHGDCWNNNMMFKYKRSDTTAPEAVTFLDFQIARSGSPILDLSYYLYAVADNTTLDEFDYLLEEYYKVLDNYLEEYNIDSNDIVTLEKLKTSWRKYGRFGLVMAPFIVRTELCDGHEVVEFTEKMSEGIMGDVQVGIIERQDAYEKRIYDVFVHFADRFL